MPHRKLYRQQPPRISADILRADKSDMRGAMNPLTGIWGTCVTAPSYLASAPNGAGDVGSRATVHCSLLSVHWTFTFSAKERDPETGLSYFGARYYNSDLSIWLSVDPMSAKYPHQSNYVYCSNNPIKVVDPNGEDEWDLSRDGYLTKRKNGRTDVDVVYATDKNGKEISRYYKAGTINQNPNSYPGVLYEGKPEERRFTTDIMTFADADVAVDFFEFAAENTEVEWALNIGETTTIVGTSHQSDLNKVSYPPNLLSQTHSHWNDGQKLSFRGANGEPCPTCDIPMMIDNPYTYKVYEAFNHRYASMDDQRNLRNEISKNVQKSINLLKKTNHFWFR